MALIATNRLPHAGARKSLGRAYALLLISGGLGGHRFYLGQTGSAFVMLLLAAAGIATAEIMIGFVFLAIVLIWVLIDAMLIPFLARGKRRRW